MSLIIERRPNGFGISAELTKALDPSNSYYEEDVDAILFILRDEDENQLPHTWGSASFKARLQRLRPHVAKHESWCRWKLDEYKEGSICFI